MLKGHVFFNFIRGRRGCDMNYGSWIYNYLCNQCLSPLTLWLFLFLFYLQQANLHSPTIMKLRQVRVMVFNATFNNISAISWWSVLLVKEHGVPGVNQRPIASH
jgi:hypothetical protein